jgi:hypothetical protein
MNSPSTLYAMLQAIVVFLIFFGAFLALFLCMMLCLIAAEVTCAGAIFVRTKMAKPDSAHNSGWSEGKGNTHVALPRTRIAM